MASESERVTIRIPPDKIQQLHQLVKQGEFDTISEAIRAAIDKFIDQQFAPDYIRKLTIELPKGNVVELQHLVNADGSLGEKAGGWERGFPCRRRRSEAVGSGGGGGHRVGRFTRPPVLAARTAVINTDR